MTGLAVRQITSREALPPLLEHHYLHRRPPISQAFGLFRGSELRGALTLGTPPSRHLQVGVCPSDPSQVVELNRLWVSDLEPPNTESWFASRALRLSDPRIVVSYADPVHGHLGYIYRALNFNYAGWTDMDRKTPRYDYLPAQPGTHTRDAFRNGYTTKRRRVAKVRYWTVTGDRRQRRDLTRLCRWPSYSWTELPPPVLEAANPQPEPEDHTA